MQKTYLTLGATVFALLLAANAFVYARRAGTSAGPSVPPQAAPMLRSAPPALPPPDPGILIQGRRVQPYSPGDGVIVVGDPVLSRLANEEAHMTSAQTHGGMDGPFEREILRREAAGEPCP